MKIMEIKVFLNKPEKNISSNITLCLRELEQEQTKPSSSWRKDTIKIGAEINEIETNKIESIKESKVSFSEKIKLINLWPDSS